MKADENVEKVRTLAATDCRLGIRMTAERLNVDIETAKQISTRNLNMRNVCAKWSHTIRQLLAIKQMPTLGQANTHQTLPRVTFSFFKN
jgi:hypothetical protein